MGMGREQRTGAVVAGTGRVCSLSIAGEEAEVWSAQRHKEQKEEKIASSGVRGLACSTQHHQGVGLTLSLGPVSMGKKQRTVWSGGGEEVGAMAAGKKEFTG